jgi:voltage-gated sodium channel
MARDIMEVYPWAPLFFVPFIIIATFTVLNLFIGIIVSTMQELSTLPEAGVPKKDLAEALARIESDIQGLRRQIENEGRDVP